MACSSNGQDTINPAFIFGPDGVAFNNAEGIGPTTVFDDRVSDWIVVSSGVTIQNAGKNLDMDGVAYMFSAQAFDPSNLTLFALDKIGTFFPQNRTVSLNSNDIMFSLFPTFPLSNTFVPADTVENSNRDSSIAGVYIHFREDPATNENELLVTWQTTLMYIPTNNQYSWVETTSPNCDTTKMDMAFNIFKSTTNLHVVQGATLKTYGNKDWHPKPENHFIEMSNMDHKKNPYTTTKTPVVLQHKVAKPGTMFKPKDPLSTVAKINMGIKSVTPSKNSFLSTVENVAKTALKVSPVLAEVLGLLGL